MARTAESKGSGTEGGGSSPGARVDRTELETGSNGHASFRVRGAGPLDLERILAVERASFSAPWSLASFQALLDREDVFLLVLETEEGRRVGHGVLWWVHEEGEVANLAVDPEWRGRGGGGRILDALLGRARTVGVERVFLEVRVSNRAAASLYASRGFRPIGFRRNYYTRPREDARVMQLSFPDRGEPNP